MRKVPIAIHTLFGLMWLLALGAGYLGLDFGNHWDEGPIFRGIMRSVNSGRVLPDWYNYPSTTHNLVMLCAIPDRDTIAQEDAGRPDFTATKMRARGLFLFLTMLGMLWVYLAVLVWGRPPTEALLAAALLGGSWEVGYHARWIAPDGVTMQFVALFILVTSLMLRSGHRDRWVWLCAIVAGLACGVKYTGGIWLVTVLAYTSLGSKETAPRRVRNAVVALVLFALTVIAATPGIVLDTRTFLGDVAFEIRHYATRHEGYTVPRGLVHAGLMLQYLALAAFSKYLFISLTVTGLATVGTWDVLRRDRRLAFVLAIIPAAYFVFLSSQSVMLVRNLLMLFPGLAILGARGASVVIHRLKPRLAQRVVAAAVTILVLVNVGWLFFAAQSIRTSWAGESERGIVRHLRAHAGETVFVSARVRAALSNVDALPVQLTRRREEATHFVFAMCDGFDRKAWPANRYGRWHQVGGPFDINLDYYPTWGGDCRVLAIDPETAAALGPIRGQ